MLMMSPETRFDSWESPRRGSAGGDRRLFHLDLSDLGNGEYALPLGIRTGGRREATVSRKIRLR
jgi:hypothetical protein